MNYKGVFEEQPLALPGSAKHITQMGKMRQPLFFRSLAAGGSLGDIIWILFPGFIHCTVSKTIEEIELRILQPFRGLSNFSLSFNLILNS